MDINTILLLVITVALLWVLVDVRRLKRVKLVPAPKVATPQDDVRKEVVSTVLSDEFFQEHLQLNETVKSLDQVFRKNVQAVQQKLLVAIETNGTSVLNEELAAYREALSEARKAVVSVTAETAKQLEAVQATIHDEAKAAAEQEKIALMSRFETRLEDVVTQYLTEALGEDVDLGAQKSYILKQLDAHKAEMKRDINDEF